MNPASPHVTEQFSKRHLMTLESQAVTHIREVAAECERPVLLFSGGKDSIVLLHLALKSFRARAKERVFSHRDRFGQWHPKNQRPEPWDMFNSKLARGEHFRVFPLSHWTELDIWQYILAEGIELPELYFARKRRVFARDGFLYSPSPFIDMRPDEPIFEEKVRFRTLGDMTCTGAIRSEAETLVQILAEVSSARLTERGATRADDRSSDAAMEDRKKEGYF